jgi:hypothetical protein
MPFFERTVGVRVVFTHGNSMKKPRQFGVLPTVQIEALAETSRLTRTGPNPPALCTDAPLQRQKDKRPPLIVDILRAVKAVGR